MNELSLFTGAGGGVLGTKLLGFRHIGYVEWDDYCQKVLAQRIKDCLLDEAPIFSDIRAFISEGYAASYTGMVDVITAGFPCQPFSVAGKQRGPDDERNMWPATADVIRIVKPRRVLLENVPGIREYLPLVVSALRRLGYTVRRPLQLGADDVGAPHRRKRIWILANAAVADPESMQRTKIEREQPNRILSTLLAHTEGITERPGLCPNGSGGVGRRRLGNGGSEMADTRSDGRTERREDDSEHDRTKPDAEGEHIPNSKKSRLEREDAERDTCFNGRTLQQFGCDGWPAEPDVGRVAHGVASRVDRLKAIGNGQVPRVVATAWKLLFRDVVGTE